MDPLMEAIPRPRWRRLADLAPRLLADAFGLPKGYRCPFDHGQGCALLPGDDATAGYGQSITRQ